MKHQDSRLAAAVIFVAVFCAFTEGRAVAQEWALVDSTSFQFLCNRQVRLICIYGWKNFISHFSSKIFHCF